MSVASGAVEVVDRHWAVAALDASVRATARADAQRAWNALLKPGATRIGRLTASQVVVVTEVAAAYERAALDRAELLAASGRVTESATRLHAELEAAAGRAFELRRALPLPADATPLLQAVLHLSGLSLMADRSRDLELWVRATQVDAALVPPEGASWNTAFELRLARIWLELLQCGGTGERIEQAFDLLGALREERPDAEAELLSALAITDAQQMRARLYALYYLADAAAALTLHARRGPLRETAERLAADFESARAIAFGEPGFDRAVEWLRLAAERIATRQSAQIEIPGLAT